MYIIRHGQTDYNKKGIVQGSTIDSSLNETGKLQAHKFFEAYQHLPFDHIFVSALQRTYQTISPFLQKEINVSRIAELNEINWGEMEGKYPDEETTKQFMEILERWKNGELDLPAAGGESPNQMYSRQKIAIQKIEAMEWENILVCIHGRCMRSFLCLLTGAPLQEMDNFAHGNVCLYVLEKSAEEKNWRILVNNSRTHLHDISE